MTSTSPTALSFFVAGVPIPQGSMKAVTVKGKKFTQLISDNGALLNPWRGKVVNVATLARNVHGWPTNYTGAVQLSCRFILPMPSARPAAARRAGIDVCRVKPDLDKLMRAIGDALTIADILDDDSRIVQAHLAKYEVLEHRLCGVEVVLQMMTEFDTATSTQSLLARRRAAPPPIGARA